MVHASTSFVWLQYCYFRNDGNQSLIQLLSHGSPMQSQHDILAIARNSSSDAIQVRLQEFQAPVEYEHTHFQRMNKFERSVPLYGDSRAQAIMIVLNKPPVLNEEKIATTTMREDA